MAFRFGFEQNEDGSVAVVETLLDENNTVLFTFEPDLVGKNREELIKLLEAMVSDLKADHLPVRILV